MQRVALVFLGALLAAGGCQRAGRVCVTSEDCPSDQICLNARCHLSCLSQRDCPGSISCLHGVCMTNPDFDAAWRDGRDPDVDFADSGSVDFADSGSVDHQPTDRVLDEGDAGGPDCVEVSVVSGWDNAPFSPLTAQFYALWNMSPGGDLVDLVVGLSEAASENYEDFAVQVRFNDSGFIDARDGSQYAAATALTYQEGVSYRVDVLGDVATGRYTIWVTPPEEEAVIIGYDHSFRTEQSAVTSLANRGYRASTRTSRICDFTIGRVE